VLAVFMREPFYITILLILSSLHLLAQPDCIVFFKYVGSIKSDTVKIAKIGLPTTDFLGDYVTKEDRFAFFISKVKDSLINQVLISHMSSEFCMETDSIIKYFFKKKKIQYLVELFENQNSDSTKYRIVEILIPLDSIKFRSEIINGRKGIIVDLGRIKI
jgi:hypothetical protein